MDTLLRQGNTNCGGCGMSITLQMLRRAIGDNPVHLVIPACCGAPEISRAVISATILAICSGRTSPPPRPVR